MVVLRVMVMGRVKIKLVGMVKVILMELQGSTCFEVFVIMDFKEQNFNLQLKLTNHLELDYLQFISFNNQISYELFIDAIQQTLVDLLELNWDCLNRIRIHNYMKMLNLIRNYLTVPALYP